MNAVDAASKAEIETIHTLLHKKAGPLYADLWKVGVNLSLRIGDLLCLKYADLDLAGRSLTLTEAKTGKVKTLRLNAAAIAVIVKRQQQYPDDVYMFQVRSNRAKNQPIGRFSVSRAFKEAGDLLGLRINTHSMRKSRGMAMYKDGVPVEKIAKVLNHSNTSSTLRYLGITGEEVLKTYDDYEL
jgi:integrase